MPEGSAILLSVKPKFASLIVEGRKLVELRRVVPAQLVGTIAVYASSPLQSIVALADVSAVVEASLSGLWTVSKAHGGGLTKNELYEYFKNKSVGYAFLLENVRAFRTPVQPSKIFKSFTPPQSFIYLSPKNVKKLESYL